MKYEGPLLEHLTHRLAECPSDFLDEPIIGSRGTINVEAVVSDLVMDLGGEMLSERGGTPFRTSVKNRRNFLRLVLITSWLFHDEWFRAAGSYARDAYGFLKKELEETAQIVNADLFVTDPDRREELVRLCLNALNLRPKGETTIQSADRLKTLSSVERSKVLAETRAAEAHARKVREAMREKKAREAAAKVGHE